MAGDPDSRPPSDEIASDTVTRRSVAFGRMRMRFNIALGRFITLAAPGLGVLALFLSLSWFGVFRMVPDWARLALLALFAIGFAVSLWPLARLRAPSRVKSTRGLKPKTGFPIRRFPARTMRSKTRSRRSRVVARTPPPDGRKNRRA
jgi:hypothetical protein